MQKLPEASDKKRGGTCAKKEARSLLTATSGVTTPKSILLLVEGTIRPSLDDALANLFTSSSSFFYQRPTTKSTKLWSRQNHQDTI